MEDISKELLINIGHKLRERRKELNLTQGDVAELLGISLNFYGQIERGEKRLSLEKLILVYENLNLDLTYLLTGIMPIESSLSKYLTDCPKNKKFDMEQLIRYAGNLYK